MNRIRTMTGIQKPNSAIFTKLGFWLSKRLEASFVLSGQTTGKVILFVV